MIGEDNVAMHNAEVVAELGTVFFIGETGETKRKKQRVLRHPFNVGDLCAGERIGQRLTCGIKSLHTR